MKKKVYSTPLMEVEQINLSKCLLDASPVTPPTDTHPDLPIGPGAAPKHNTPAF